MALHSHNAVTVSAAVATRSRADCSSMEDRRGNKRPYQPQHSLCLFSQSTVNEWNILLADCVHSSNMNMFKNRTVNYLARAGYTCGP